MNVVRRGVGHFNGGYDVRPSPNRTMSFQEDGGGLLTTVLFAVPPTIFRCAKTRRVNGEVGFDRCKRLRAFLDHRVKNVREVGILESVEDAVVVGSAVDVALGREVAQVGLRTTTGSAAVHLHNGAEDAIRERQARATTALRRVVDRRAEVVKKNGDALFLMRLRRIVGGPFLPVRDAKRFGHGSGLRFRLALHDKFDSVDMLALFEPLLEIRTRASRRDSRRIDDVRALSGLRRDDPKVALLVELLCGRNLKAALLSSVHAIPSRYNLLGVYLKSRRKSTLQVLLDGRYLLGVPSNYGEGETCRILLRSLRARVASARQEQGPDDLPQVQVAILEHTPPPTVKKAQWGHSSTGCKRVAKHADFSLRFDGVAA